MPRGDMTISECTAPDTKTAPTSPDWDEAFLRVESYLRAHGLESRVLINQITSEIIREALALVFDGRTGAPVTLALQLTHQRIGEWYARTGQEIDWTNERMRAQGRLALVNADLPGRWPNAFLSPDPVPADLAAAIASFQLLPAPELYLSAMPPAPLEFGFHEPGDHFDLSRRMWLPARTLVSWLLIFGVFGMAWAASH
jgi:hypothetical protein